MDALFEVFFFVAWTIEKFYFILFISCIMVKIFKSNFVIQPIATLNFITKVFKTTKSNLHLLRFYAHKIRVAILRNS